MSAIRTLQRTAGNAAVTSLLQSRREPRSSTVHLQRTLTDEQKAIAQQDWNNRKVELIELEKKTTQAKEPKALLRQFLGDTFEALVARSIIADIEADSHTPWRSVRPGVIDNNKILRDFTDLAELDAVAVDSSLKVQFLVSIKMAGTAYRASRDRKILSTILKLTPGALIKQTAQASQSATEVLISEQHGQLKFVPLAEFRQANSSLAIDNLRVKGVYPTGSAPRAPDIATGFTRDDADELENLLRARIGLETVVATPGTSIAITNSSGEGTVKGAVSGSTSTTTTALTRGSVQSWELLMGDGTINYRRSSDEAFQPVNDSTDSNYLDQAERSLGRLEPLNILARWKILPPGLSSSGAWWRAHLIGAEFGGQKKYPSPADNVRYHPQALEQGEWQKSERKVKHSVQGQFSVESKANKTAADALAHSVLNVLGADLPTDAAAPLRSALAGALQAAQYVPESVRFEYVDSVEPSRSFAKDWPKQDALLQVEASATKDSVWGALAEMRNLGFLEGVDIPIPDTVKVSKPQLEINSFDELDRFLRRLLLASDAKRKSQIRTKLTNLLKAPATGFGDAEMAKQLTNLPEMKQMNLDLSVKDFRSWLSKETVANLLKT